MNIRHESNQSEQRKALRVKRVGLPAAVLALTAVAAACTPGATEHVDGRPAASSTPTAAPSAIRTPEAPHKVAKTLTSAQREAGLNILGSLDDVEPSQNTEKLVVRAYRDSRKIQNPHIRVLVGRAIDSSVASAVALDGGSYIEKSEVEAAESMVGLIRNEKIQAQADRALDLVEAENALNTPVGEDLFATYLVHSIEDESLRQRTAAALENDNTDTLWGVFDDKSTNAWNDLEDWATSAWGDVYKGSDSQAEQINQDVQEYRDTVRHDN
jgi:hypothetical protein